MIIPKFSSGIDLTTLLQFFPGGGGADSSAACSRRWRLLWLCSSRVRRWRRLGFGMILVCIGFNRSSTARVMFGVCYVLFSDLCRRYSAINALMIMSSKEERTAVNFHHIQQREIAFAACCLQPCSFLYGVCHTRSGNIVQEKVRSLHGWNT